MFAVFVFFVALFLLAALMPKPNIENARAAKLGDFQFPRSKHGDPVPLVWGTVRLKSPITAWYGDFRPIPMKKKIKTGFFSSKKVTVGYKNYMGIDCLLCLGPSVSLRKFWAGTHLVWTGNVTTTGNITINEPELFGGDEAGGGLVGTIRFYEGDFNPTQDSYLVEKIGPNVPAYNGFSRALFKSFYIGTSTTPEAFSFEVSKLTTGLHATYSIMPNGLDANPMEIAYDAITQDWGKFNNLESDLDLASFITAAETLYNEGVGMSLSVQSSITGKDLLEEVMIVADGILYQDPATSKIVAKLVRQDYTTGSLLVLDKSSIKSLSGFQKTTWENTVNQCRVTFKDRNNNYDTSVAITQDFANINFQNRVKSIEIASPGCTEPAVASILAARQLSLLNVPLYKCDIISNRKAQGLRPGDVFVLDWEPFNITGMVMRILKIDFGDLTSNEIKMSCIQDRFATATVTFGNSEVPTFTPVDNEPHPVVHTLMFTPPAFLTFNDEAETLDTFDSNGRLYVAAVAPSVSSISFDAMQSANNFASAPDLALESAPYNGGGVLMADYSASVAATDRHDTTGFTIGSVAQATIDSLLQLTSLTEARDASALLMINGELMVYVGFVDNADGTVTFPNVYRSVLDTPMQSHLANDRVWVISEADGLLPELLAVGQTRYLKLLDETSLGAITISEAPSINGTVTDRASYPLVPQNLKLNSSFTPVTTVGATSVAVSWSNRSRLDTTLRVYDDSNNDRETGTQTRVRWRVGAGGYTTLTTTGSNTNLNVAGLTGTLEVIVDSQIISNSKYSTNSNALTMELT